MEWMRRNRRAIAVVALIGMATPFVAQLVTRFTRLDTGPVIVVLFVLIFAGLGIVAYRKGSADHDV